LRLKEIKVGNDLHLLEMVHFPAQFCHYEILTYIFSNVCGNVNVTIEVFVAIKRQLQISNVDH